ncbi:MAG: OPT/YSL family transporter, partial [Candidatus Eremiobacteraeota bacterium]|nr:OPT/YSL family transporter [Candidatus Eremiobacteraeota bacterium]
AQIDWGLIGIGVFIGVVIIIIDEILRARTRHQLPPLAVGLGIYLPAATTSAAVLGAVIGWAYNRWIAPRPGAAVAKRLGVLIASGLIVGESLFGVLNAGVIVATGKAAPFALVADSFTPVATVISPIILGLTIYALLRWTATAGRRIGARGKN